MLISPTEPLVLRALGDTSSAPEEYGVDFLFTVRGMIVGVQRKEYADLIASVQGDRVYRELLLMKKLDLGIWLIEGRPQWTSEGRLTSNMSWSRRHEIGFTTSIQRRGYWLSWQDSIQGTIAYLSDLTACLSKDGSSLDTRPKPAKSEWGRVTDRDWGMHILQGFPAIGATTAASIIDTMGLPLKWTCSKADLMKVPGIGKGKAEKIWRSLDNAAREMVHGEEGGDQVQARVPVPMEALVQEP